MRYILISLFIFMALGHIHAAEREKYNFNSDWKLKVGDIVQAEEMDYSDAEWKSVTLPHAFNEDEAFKLNIKDLTDTIVWYRKHFRLPADAKGRKVFIEFEGARQGIDLYVNGHLVGQHENGVMAFGFDLTAFVKPGKENVIAARIDNNWDYAEKATGVKYQWSNRNFNANYGGLPKNVWLYVTDKLYQTLPLYSNLQTTGVYIYAEDIQVRARKARIHAESEVKNETKKSQTVGYLVELFDRDGKLVKSFCGEEKKINPGEKIVLSAESEVEGLHFWSWGYGYLYTVKTALCIEGKKTDEVITRTGFRKTRFADGKVWLNDRVIQLKGFAQRTSNEWPAVGMSVPAWLSDYSNGLMVKANANLVRWMHVTPWKQDVESCDRVGLIQAMPAGDAEKDCKGRQWEQRKLVMRDAIIYNRNNPSILFYECGNESISREHMLEMKKIRDEFDYHGGRAIGSREMLDIRDAEYGGEMLYINKSAHHPMWAMEYCRDEGLRKYWDNYSYPYHKDGEGNSAYHSAATGKTKKQADASVYNRNQDSFTIENVIRWFDYWRERPGTGKRVSSGGAKIIFSDTNTHFRGVENYRRSGDTDPMRIPKDSYFAHQVMWDGWVDTENPRLHIVGHWNYEPGVVKPVYVVSNTDSVALFLNGKPMGQAQRDCHFLFTFDKIAFTPGVLEAVGYNDGKEAARMQLRTAGRPAKLKLSAIQHPKGWKADGADLVLLQVEVADAEGNRCPLANNLIHFMVEGPAEWRGGIAQGSDNYILSEKLPVECGVNRALLRSSVTAGKVVVRAEAEGLASASLELVSSPVEVQNGLSTYIPGDDLEGSLDRGETPLSPSYIDRAVDVAVLSAEAGINTEEACKSCDDNELSEWKNDGKASTAWIKYHLERIARVDEVCMKLTGWRMRSYPLEIYAGDELIWSGETEKSLGYVHLKVKPVPASEITIRLKGSSKEDDAFGQIVEVAAPVANELDLFKAKDGDKTNHELRIVEVEFKESLNR
ncbi:glycoside hydrolase family 2 protein [Phocaeicola plebeius]|uniref:glycoside hydrolase family 2 protein n=1 Tax=Phocaeicola plebeius TaxID=310297 RepID=UPI003569EEA7